MPKIFVTLLCIFLAPHLAISQESFPSIASQYQPEIKLIVIDPGLGGGKFGAAACDSEVSASDINLQISKQVAERLEDLNLKVVLTRDDDTDPSLEQRASIANANQADLFISISVNTSEKPSASGIESFYLNLTTDTEAIQGEATKNTDKSKDTDDMLSIFLDLMQSSKLQESEILAKNIQNELFRQMSEKHSTVIDRGIKQAPFYLLMATQMPAVAIYPGFLTNPHECKLLASSDYQKQISIGIVTGLQSFINERRTQPINVADPKNRSAN